MSVGRPFTPAGKPKLFLEIIPFSWRNVMKKLILPLLLLVAFGMLAAVESAPSAVVGYVKYQCYTGYSYVAIPMGSGGLAEQLVENNMPNITSIFKWNSATQTWNSIDYDAEFMEWTGSIPVVPGDVLLLACSGQTDFYSIGELPTPYSYTLSAGYNYINVPVTQGSITTAEQIGDGFGTVPSIQKWINSSQSWTSIDYDSEFMEWTGSLPVQIGDVLLLSSTGSATWPVRSSDIGQLKSSK
jgi:hypothetical protein